jgi:8-oxo-dGTP diphosphatase
MMDIDPDAHHKDSNIRPAVGIGVMIRRGSKVLLGKRRGAHGFGHFGWPGGGLSFGESLMDAVRREASEEAGLTVKEAELICVSNVVQYGRHYLDLEFQVTAFEGQPIVKEPEFIESWNWYDLDSLPNPLFKPCEYALASLRSGRMLNDERVAP